MTITTTEIRRIFLRHDAEEIRHLQQNAPEFAQHYPRHNDWLRMAIGEIVDGKRFAFGIYKSAIDEANRTPVLRLVGSIILKTELYSHAIQLKNLYVRTDERKKGHGRKLFAAVEQFCIKRGARIIETEVPYTEHGTVHFLSKMGFHVQNAIDSPYRRGDRIYRMFRELPSKYAGDPFDLFSITEWLYGDLFAFDVSPTADQRLLFTAKPRVQPTLKINNDVALQGAIHVFDDAVPVDKQKVDALIKNEPSHHVFAIYARSFSANGVATARRHHIRTYTRAELLDSLRDAFVVPPPDFEREAIGGMIVSINAHYTARLNADLKTMTYFKGGPTGKYLRPGSWLFFYAEKSVGNEIGGVIARARVDSTTVGEPVSMWKMFRESNPIFPEDEYKSWAVDKSEVVAISVSDIALFTPGVPASVVKGSIRRGDVDFERLGDFYLTQQETTSLVAALMPPSPTAAVLSAEQARGDVTVPLAELLAGVHQLREAIEQSEALALARSQSLSDVLARLESQSASQATSSADMRRSVEQVSELIAAMPTEGRTALVGYIVEFGSNAWFLALLEALHALGVANVR